MTSTLLDVWVFSSFRSPQSVIRDPQCRKPGDRPASVSVSIPRRAGERTIYVARLYAPGPIGALLLSAFHPLRAIRFGAIFNPTQRTRDRFKQRRRFRRGVDVDRS